MVNLNYAAVAIDKINVHKNLYLLFCCGQLTDFVITQFTAKYSLSRGKQIGDLINIRKT